MWAVLMPILTFPFLLGQARSVQLHSFGQRLLHKLTLMLVDRSLAEVHFPASTLISDLVPETPEKFLLDTVLEFKHQILLAMPEHQTALLYTYYTKYVPHSLFHLG